jgi:hypothetical protein
MTRMENVHDSSASASASRLRKLPPLLRDFGKKEGGAALVLAAILFPVVIGGMGLGAETGYWYMTQRKLQHAADTSVHAAAVRKRAGDTKTNIDAAATYIATGTGFSPLLGNLTVNVPPTSGAYAGNVDSIEVLIEETRDRLFSAVFSSERVAFAARAVALITSSGSTACVLALSPTASGAVTFSGSPDVNLDGCEVASNSNAPDSFLMSGSSKLSTDCVNTVGGAKPTSGLTLNDCSAVRQYAPAILDPYASVAQPADQGKCESKTFHPQNLNELPPYLQGHPSGLPVYRFCGSVQFKGQVEFGPGLYIFSGGTVAADAGAVLSGSEVTFYFTGGAALNFNGNAKVNLSARTDDPYKGILFFGDRDDAGIIHTVNGGAGGSLEGAVYLPAGEVKFAGGTQLSGGCTQVIGNTVTFTGNSKLGSSCATAGTSDVVTNQIVSIVE